MTSRLTAFLACALALLAACGGGTRTCAPDAGPSAACCQPNGNDCAANADCCSGNCILRTSPGFCCVPGGCP